MNGVLFLDEIRLITDDRIKDGRDDLDPRISIMNKDKGQAQPIRFRYYFLRQFP